MLYYIYVFVYLCITYHMCVYVWKVEKEREKKQKERERRREGEKEKDGQSQEIPQCACELKGQLAGMGSFLALPVGWLQVWWLVPGAAEPSHWPPCILNSIRGHQCISCSAALTCVPAPCCFNFTATWVYPRSTKSQPLWRIILHKSGFICFQCVRFLEACLVVLPRKYSRVPASRQLFMQRS